MANSADLDQKPTDLDLQCLQRQGTSGFSRTRVNMNFLGVLKMMKSIFKGCL